ncbi:MAG: hypothetical protein SGARI_006197 [Bacillariaceae sp.]
MKQQRLLPNQAAATQHDNTSTSLINVQLLGKQDRIEQATYNSYMTGTAWCLILCGDTPSSRTLTSSMLFGCIPVRYPHLPYADKIDWDSFPEMNEGELLNSTKKDTLERLFAKYTWEDKAKLRSTMSAVQRGWIYGWGDPITSSNDTLGDAASFIWESFVDALQKEGNKT